MKPIAFLGVLGLGAVLSGCVSNPIRPADQLMTSAPMQAPAITKDTALRQKELQTSLMNSNGRVDMASLQEYVDRLMAGVLKAAGVTEPCCQVVIVADTSLDAHARSSGAIFISLGWLLHAESEAEIAALIAHEAAHVLMGHHGSNVVSEGGLLLKQGLNFAKDLNLVKGEVAFLGNLVGSSLDKLVHPAWNRGQEGEADRFAIEITRRMGYDFTQGIAAVLSRIADQEKHKKAALEKEKAARQSTLNLSSVDGLFDSLFKDAQARHDDAVKRGDDAVDYYEKISAKIPAPGQRPDNRLPALTGRNEVASLLTRHREASRAEEALGVRRHKEALAILNKIGGKPVRQQGLYPNLLLCDTLADSGQSKQAEACYHQAMDAKVGSWLPYIKLARWLKGNGRAGEAVSLVDQGYQTLGQPEELLPDLIAFTRDTDVGAKNRYLSSCTFQKSAVLRDACTQAAQESGGGSGGLNLLPQIGGGGSKSKSGLINNLLKF